MARQRLSKKLRFEVFKRDSFTCQYCGCKAPDVTLQVDHIEPVAAGGTNDLLNLTTSCIDCNAGKSDRRLSDDSVVVKRRRQIEDVQEREEQLRMLLDWQRSLAVLEDKAADEVAAYWGELVPPYSLTEHGKGTLRKTLAKFGVEEVMTAMRTAVRTYVTIEEGQPTAESVELAWKKVRGICSIERASQTKPYLKRLLYIRGILRNRLAHVNEPLALQLLEGLAVAGFDLDYLEAHAKEVPSWTQWRDDVEEMRLDADEPRDLVEAPEPEPVVQPKGPAPPDDAGGTEAPPSESRHEIRSSEYPWDMSGWCAEKSENVVWALARLSEAVKKGRDLDENLREGIEFFVHSALHDATKLLSFAAGAPWDPDHRDLVVEFGVRGYEELLVLYGLMDETTEDREEREWYASLDQRDKELSDLAYRVRGLVDQARGEARVPLFELVHSCAHDVGEVHTMREWTEAVSQGEVDWVAYTAVMRREAQALLDRAARRTNQPVLGPEEGGAHVS